MLYFLESPINECGSYLETQRTQGPGANTLIDMNNIGIGEEQ